MLLLQVIVIQSTYRCYDLRFLILLVPYAEYLCTLELWLHFFNVALVYITKIAKLKSCKRCMKNLRLHFRYYKHAWINICNIRRCNYQSSMKIFRYVIAYTPVHLFLINQSVCLNAQIRTKFHQLNCSYSKNI